MSETFDGRVLLIDSGRTWRGGQRQVLFLLRGLVEQGVDFTLAAPPGSELLQRAASYSSALFPIGITGGIDAGAALAVRRLLRARRIDVVHAHDSHSHSVASMATLGARGRVNVVVSRRTDTAVAGNLVSALKYRMGADLYLAISNEVRSRLLEGGVAESRVVVVPSGIDLDQIAAARSREDMRRQLNFGESEIVVGTLAALTEEKGHSFLIKAAQLVCASHPRARFAVFGDGPLRGKLVEQSVQLGLEKKVMFFGHRDDPLDVIAGLDLFVMPSSIEGLGSSIMDAQALGVPVVASATGGIPDVVEHEKTGLLCTPGDVASLSDAITRMMDERDLRERIVDAARKESRRYDFHEMVYKTVEAYRALRARKEEVEV